MQEDRSSLIKAFHLKMCQEIKSHLAGNTYEEDELPIDDLLIIDTWLFIYKQI